MGVLFLLYNREAPAHNLLVPVKRHVPNKDLKDVIAEGKVPRRCIGEEISLYLGVIGNVLTVELYAPDPYSPYVEALQSVEKVRTEYTGYFLYDEREVRAILLEPE